LQVIETLDNSLDGFGRRTLCTCFEGCNDFIGEKKSTPSNYLPDLMLPNGSGLQDCDHILPEPRFLFDIITKNFPRMAMLAIR